MEHKYAIDPAPMPASKILTQEQLNKGDKIKLVVIDGDTLAYVPPNSKEAYILHASILRGASQSSNPIYLTDKKLRLAAEKDFDDFRVSFEGFNNEGMYEWDKSEFADGGMITLQSLTPEQQGALVVNSLKKGDKITVDNIQYEVTRKTEIESRVKNLKTGKTGQILHTALTNHAWMKNRKDGVATGFFRGIEADITRSLLDGNNPLGSTQTESYKRALEELATINQAMDSVKEHGGTVPDTRRKHSVIVFDNDTKHIIDVEASVSQEELPQYLSSLYPTYDSYVLNSRFNYAGKKFGQGGTVQLSNDSVRKESSDDKQGGMVEGKRHAECDETGCGETFIVEKDGRKVELEAKEAVLCAEAMSNQQKFDFAGEKMTGKEIASFLNKHGGGVSFASDNVDVKPQEKAAPSSKPIKESQVVTNLTGGESILTVKTMDSNDKFEFQGKKMTPRQIASFINVNSGGKKFAFGGDVDDEEDEHDDFPDLRVEEQNVNEDFDSDVPDNNTEGIKTGIKQKEIHLTTLDEFLENPTPVIVFDNNNTFVLQDIGDKLVYKNKLPIPMAAEDMYYYIIRMSVDDGTYTDEIAKGVLTVDGAFALIKAAHIRINDELKEIMQSKEVDARFSNEVKLSKMLYFVNKLLNAMGHKILWKPKRGDTVIYVEKSLKGLVSDRLPNDNFEIMLYNKLGIVNNVVELSSDLLVPFDKKTGNNYIDYICEETDVPNFEIQVIKNNSLFFTTFIKNKALIASAMNKLKDKMGSGEFKYITYYNDGRKSVIQDTIAL